MRDVIHVAGKRSRGVVKLYVADSVYADTVSVSPLWTINQITWILYNSEITRHDVQATNLSLPILFPENEHPGW